MILNTPIERNLLLSFIQNIPLAKEYFAKTTLTARQELSMNNVLEALKHLHCAYQIAELLLEIDEDQARSERRYASAITDLAYIFRLLDHHRSLMQLQKKAQNKVRQYCFYYLENDLLRGINFVFECSNQTAQEWLIRFQRLSQHAPDLRSVPNNLSGMSVA